MFGNVKKLYFELLPMVVSSTSFIGFMAGLDNNLQTKNKSKSFYFTFASILGMTTIGTFIGLTYPISFPICSAYIVLHEDDKTK
jgi:L-cystine uptake protein TcyP (sodium:dicarboxylate symporter family)